MNGLIFTIAQNGYAAKYAPMIESQRLYAQQNGLEFVCVERPRFVGVPALSAWLKVKLMEAALEMNYEWVAYIDADCEVRAGCADFRDEFSVSDSSVFMANGRSGRLNSGVMFARNTDDARSFFGRVVESITESVPEEARQGLKYENGNIIHVASLHGGVEVIDAKWNNTFDADLADNIRHYTGPLRALYTPTLTRRVSFAIQKRLVRKPSAQPECRDQAFVGDLDELTGAVAAQYTEFSPELMNKVRTKKVL